MHENNQQERRNRALTDDDVDAICTRLTEFSGLTPEEHKEHHDAVKLFVEERRRRMERNEKIKTQVGGWMVVTVLAAIGHYVWQNFLTVIGKGS